MNVAIIPARGGSKRLPRKNIRNFFGKPIIAYSIDAALKSGVFDRVVVSTDDAEIALVANRYGAETPFLRPKELSDDFTGTNAVTKHAISWLQSQGIPVTVVCCIYATAPLLQVNYLLEGYHKLINSKKSFVFSVTSFPFPIQRAVRINKQNEIEAFWPENYHVRSQDFEKSYHDCGQFYWGFSDSFLNDEPLFSNKSLPVILPRSYVQDIDDEEDWRQAELMFEVLKLNK
jgi:pseudaminic acid cytidylyltransferase